jgi:hypothetical protein
MAGQINLESNVDYCTVTTASTPGSKEEESGTVTARIIIHLKKALEEGT